MTQQDTQYQRIAKAIEFINSHYKSQPTLEELAAEVNLSAYHFQRLFIQWAGVSPKKFIQYISLEHAKYLLKEEQSTLLEAVHETGLSSTSRLHDLFINIEHMTPGEYKNGGKSLSINYGYADSPFGQMIVASTSKGICHISFTEQKQNALQLLRKTFPHAVYQQTEDKFQHQVTSFFAKDWTQLNDIKLHVHGSAFQLKVWQSLLKIPEGKLVSYGNIANSIEQPNASRAVGTAIGCNPVAFLIPCHRVIRSSGELGGYLWGITRKSAMIGWEASRAKQQ